VRAIREPDEALLERIRQFHDVTAVGDRIAVGGGIRIGMTR
jgi:hypothetical protein